MRKHLLLPGNGILIYHVPAGQTADRAGNSTISSFACRRGETAPVNYPDNDFSATSLTGQALAVKGLTAARPGKTLPTRVVNPAGPLPAGKIAARQPVSAWRKAVPRWSMPGPVQGILAGVFRLYNLVNAAYSMITLMHQRRCTHRRRPAYCCLS